MPYTPTAWTNGTTPVNATNMNHLETQYTESTLSFNPDLFTAFVLSGLVCTKDGTTASQLDVTAGDAYLQQSDGTLRQRKPGSTNFSTAGNLSTTMYLDLNPDGTWSWGTAHSGVANHLTICTVTTDGSGNIATVTDARPLGTTLLSGGAATWLTLPFNLTVGGAIFVGPAVSGSQAKISDVAGILTYNTPTAGGAALGHAFGVWSGSTALTPFSIGGQFDGALAWIDDSGVFNSVLPGMAGDQSHIILQQLAAAGATANTLFLSMTHTGGLDIFDNNAGKSILAGGGNGISVAPLSTVGGQVSAGSFGVPVVVAQAINQSVTSTAFTTIAGFAVPADGVYRCSITFTWSNVANSTITAEAQYTDPNTSSTSTVFFMSAGNGSLLNALSVLAGTITYATYPVTVYCKGGTNVNIIFRDSAGTPSDHATAMIERLS